MRLSVPQIWLAVGLILLLWSVRLIGIDSFPPFIDETIHIRSGEIILRDFSPFHAVALGRQFSIWWLMLFQPAAAHPMWVARTTTLLAILPGFAALLNIARVEAGWRAVLVFGALYVLSAYHMFYERLALADLIAGSAVTLALWFAYRLSRRIRLRDAAITGFWLFIAFGAKTSAIPFFGIPVAAALALIRQGSTRRATLKPSLQWLAVALGTGIGLSVLYVFLLSLRGFDIITNSLSLAATGRGTLDSGEIFSMQRVLNNVNLAYANLSAYTGDLALVVMLAAVTVLAARRSWYLPLCLLGPVIVIWLNTPQEARYFVTAVALLLLYSAIVLARFIRRHPHLIWAALGLVILWGIAYWLPFVTRSPAEYPLSASDYAQYVRSDAGGFGFAQVQDVLSDLHPQLVIGALANCQGLRYTLPASFPLTCPDIPPDPENRGELAAFFEASRAPGSYVVLEDSPYVPETVPGTLIAVIDVGRPRLSIYELAP